MLLVPSSSALCLEGFIPTVFPEKLALGTFWDVFHLLRDPELESSIIQALHESKPVLSLSARSQNSELIHAFPNSYPELTLLDAAAAGKKITCPICLRDSFGPELYKR